MDFPIQIKSIKKLYILRSQKLTFHNYDVFLSLRIVLTLKSVDPNEISHYAAIHLGLYCRITRLGLFIIQRVNGFN